MYELQYNTDKASLCASQLWPAVFVHTELQCWALYSGPELNNILHLDVQYIKFSQMAKNHRVSLIRQSCCPNDLSE